MKSATPLPLARIRDLAMLAVIVLVIILDQVSKHWIVSYFQIPGLRPPVSILGQVLTLDYTQNTGVAFSLFQGQNIKFLLIGLAILVIAYLYWRFRDDGSLLLKLCFGLVLGGAIGNLLDRFTNGYVVDFIHFQIPGSFDWPVFNLADSSICVGVALIAFLLFFDSWRDRPAALSGASAENAKQGSAKDVSSAQAAKASQAPGASTPRVRRKAVRGS